MEAVPGHTNLVRRGAVYYHRCKVPADIAETYGRREVTYSLKTRDLAEAVRRVKVASVETMKAFDEHRRKVAAEKAAEAAAAEARAAVSDPIERLLAAGEAMAANDAGERAELIAYSTLSRSQLNLFAELHRSIRLEDDEDARFGGFEAVRPGPGSDMLLFTADDKRLAGKKAHATEYALAESKARAFLTGSILRGKLARGEYGNVEGTAEDCLAAAGISLDMESRAWRSLLRLVQAAEVQAMADIQARNEGKEPEHRGSDEILAEIAASLVPKPVEPNSTVSAVSPHPTPAEPASAAPTLSEVRDQWLAEAATRNLADKTGDARRIMVDLFLELVGDRPIDAYAKADARAFKDVLSALPPNRSKMKVLRNLSLEAAAKKAKAAGLPPMSITNVNKHLGCLYGLFAWARKHYDEVEKNPFEGMQVEKRTNARDERDPFSLDDLKRMFAAPVYRGCVSERHWSAPGAVVLRDSPKFWVPLIGLFTGARLNEILQLYRDDIVDVDGVPCFRISADKDDQRVKTASSRRFIPVHAELLRIGFAEFVASKPGRLFDTVEKAPDGYYSSTFSKHFVRFLDTVGVKRPKVSFHSFRHTFEDACRACGVPHDVMNALQGHAQGGMADRYGGQYPLPPLVEAMRKLGYPELPLSAP